MFAEVFNSFLSLVFLSSRLFEEERRNLVGLGEEGLMCLISLLFV